MVYSTGLLGYRLMEIPIWIDDGDMLTCVGVFIEIGLWLRGDYVTGRKEGLA